MVDPEGMFGITNPSGALDPGLVPDSFRGEGPAGASLISGHSIGRAPQSTQRAGLRILLSGSPAAAGSSTPVPLEDLADALAADKPSALARLNGPFAIAVHDERDGSLTLAIDRMGVQSLSWARVGDAVVYATSSGRVAAVPGVDAGIAAQTLYDYFFFHMVPSPGSVYTGVRKLAPATFLTFRGTDAPAEARYWMPAFDADARRTPAAELTEALHQALGAAVRDRYAGPATGAFLSGGLDSSTVTGYLARAAEGPARTFSMGFGIPEYDELEYARITSSHFGCDASEYVVTPDDVVEAIGTVASSYDEPFGNSSAIPTFLCARFARERGIRTLLAGDGGDELFGGNERYGRQPVFERFGILPRPLQTGLRRMVDAAIAPEHPVTVLRKLRSYVDQASIPLPERFESWNFVYREGARVMFEDDFVATIDRRGPFALMQSVYDQAGTADLLDRMLFYDWKFTLADNDLRKVTEMCRAAGVEVAFPMLDNRVVELSARIPSRVKLRGTELRSFYKDAMRGFLPDRILTKQKKGFGLPFGDWLKTHEPLRDLVQQSLSDLKQRRIVKPAFLDRLLEEHRAGHANYYGYAIWDLVILEQWLQSHPAARLSA